jgi:transcriptional regulator GlxA family with amidase domain
MQRWSTAILVFDGVEVLDFAGPFEVFSRTRLTPGTASRRTEDTAPFNVFTVAPRAGMVTATGNLRVEPHFSLETCPPVDLLVVPGGFGTRVLVEDRAVLDWIVRVSHKATLTTSVCTGAALLARAGLLAGKKATTHWASYGWLASLDASIQVVEGVRYVEDTVITSAGVQAGMDMALAVVARLCGIAVARETAQYIEYRWEPQDQPA